MAKYHRRSIEMSLKIKRLWNSELVISDPLETAEPTSDSSDIVNMIIHGTAPEGLTVDGDLNLTGTSIKSLPCDLTINGGLNLRYVPIRALPENLVVNGYLNLSNTLIEQIPTSLKFDRYLDISGCDHISSLPYNLDEVNGYLDASNTSLVRLKEYPPEIYSSRLIPGVIYEEVINPVFDTDGCIVGYEQYNVEENRCVPIGFGHSPYATIVSPPISNLTINGFLDISMCENLVMNEDHMIPPYEMTTIVKPHNKLNSKRTTGFVQYDRRYIDAIDTNSMTADNITVAADRTLVLYLPTNYIPGNILLEHDTNVIQSIRPNNINFN